MGRNSGKNGDDWLEAKRRCRLTDEEVRMYGPNTQALPKSLGSKQFVVALGCALFALP